MKSSWYWAVLFFHVANCEWVEITPIENKKLLSAVKQVVKTTTPANYEVFMKTPLLKNEYSSTPAYNFIKHTDQESVFNNYSTNLEFVSSMELTTPLSASSSIPDNILREYEDDSTSPNLSHEGFFPFVKMIQQNLFKYKNKLHKNKMALLKYLRDHLLINIKEKITNLWKPVKRSEARGYKDEDSHMDFPSHEGALMTIGFLTFAVFLIKLVIKLVHALKYKQQYYGMSTTTTASSVVFLKRKKREEINEDAARILQYINEF